VFIQLQAARQKATLLIRAVVLVLTSHVEVYILADEMASTMASWFVTSLTRTLFRTMSTNPVTATSQRQLFFVWAPDKDEEGTFERRLSVRESHLGTAKERISNGLIRMRYRFDCLWRYG
jgi:hypothetical protein